MPLSFSGLPLRLGAIAPVRAVNVGLRPAGGLSLTRGEFTVGQAAKPFIAPMNLVWHGLPGEENRIGGNNFFARSTAFEPDSTPSHDRPQICSSAGGADPGPNGGVNDTMFNGDIEWSWVNYTLHAMRNSKRWLQGSGPWGCSEYRALRGLVAIIDEWIEIQVDVVQLAKRQVMNQPSGEFPVEIRAALDWGRSAAVADDRSFGITHRWPVEVSVLAGAILHELRWAREAFSGLAEIVKAGFQCEVIRDGACAGTVINEVGGVAAGRLYDEYLVMLAKINSMPGVLSRSGNLPPLDDSFEVFRDAFSFYTDAAKLMDAIEDYQEAAVEVVKSVLDQITKTVGGTFARGLDEMRAFAGTVMDAGAEIPIMGQFVEAATAVIDVALDNASREAANRVKRGITTLYRGVKADGRGQVLSRQDVETWALMMSRAMVLQERRINALLDGTSPLIGALRARPPGEVTQGGGSNVNMVYQRAGISNTTRAEAERIAAEQGKTVEQLIEEGEVIGVSKQTDTGKYLMYGLGAAALLGVGWLLFGGKGKR